MDDKYTWEAAFLRLPPELEFAMPAPVPQRSWQSTGSQTDLTASRNLPLDFQFIAPQRSLLHAVPSTSHQSNENIHQLQHRGDDRLIYEADFCNLPSELQSTVPQRSLRYGVPSTSYQTDQAASQIFLPGLQSIEPQSSLRYAVPSTSYQTDQAASQIFLPGLQSIEPQSSLRYAVPSTSYQTDQAASQNFLPGLQPTEPQSSLRYAVPSTSYQTDQAASQNFPPGLQPTVSQKSLRYAVPSISYQNHQAASQNFPTGLQPTVPQSSLRYPVASTSYQTDQAASQNFPPGLQPTVPQKSLRYVIGSRSYHTDQAGTQNFPPGLQPTVRQHSSRLAGPPTSYEKGQLAIYDHPPGLQFTVPDSSVKFQIHQADPVESKDNPLYNRNVMLNVFRHLSPSEIMTCSRVCKSWYQFSQDPSIWRCIDASKQFLSACHLAGIARRQPRDLILNWSVITKRQLKWLITELPRLESLSLHGTIDSTISALTECICLHLRSLDLSFSSINNLLVVQILSPFASYPGSGTYSRFRYLQNLNFSGCNITNATLRCISRSLPELSVLNLSYCRRVTDEGIVHLLSPHGFTLTNITSLNLTSLPLITDTSLENLLVSPCLIYLNISYSSQITHQAVERFRLRCFKSAEVIWRLR